MSQISCFLFTLGLGFYLICALQWFSYKFSRVIFHYTKPMWHVYFVLIPILCFVFAINFSEFIALICSLAYLVALFFWQRNLSQKLVLTPKIKRFFAILTIFSLATLYFLPPNLFLFSFAIALIMSFVALNLGEKILWLKFKKQATTKLASMPNLVVVMITASFGKTSMKNFLYDILKDDFNVQITPRSVNTIAGIVRDINENLSAQTQIYIAEAGARAKGDIDVIARFLNPHYVIIGEIGLAHIEYFKNVENTRLAKLEALNSTRLKKAFLHSSTLKKTSANIVIYDEFVSDVKADLEKTEFTLNLSGENLKLRANLLGAFNAYNIAATALVAKEFGLENSHIRSQIAKIKGVTHRLEKIEAGGKFIIDDSFNGNFGGMKESYELAREFKGRKVLLTPGIMEGDANQNEELGKIINECFDLVVITSSLNADTLKKHLDKSKMIELFDKSAMQSFLAQNTREGDLILFSNDAPSFM